MTKKRRKTPTTRALRCLYRKSAEPSAIPGWAMFNMDCLSLQVRGIVDGEVAPLFCWACGGICVDEEKRTTKLSGFQLWEDEDENNSPA